MEVKVEIEEPASSPATIFLVGAGIVCVGFWMFALPFAAGHGDGRERIIVWLTRHWATATWFHGAIVPFAALAMVWTSRKKLNAAVSAPSLWGFTLLVTGFLFLWAGYRTHVVYFGLAGIHQLIAGFVLWFFGRDHFRILLFPLAFLLLMWPLPFLEASLSFQLRIVMTELCQGILQVFGQDVIRQGTSLAWGGASDPVVMDIEGACSGLRSLFSLIAASALFAFFSLERASHRWILFLASIPFAIAGNIARIIALYVAVHLWGWEFAVGETENPSPFHVFAGILAIAIGLAGIAFLAAWLRRRGARTIRTTVSSSSSSPTRLTRDSA